MTKAANNPKSRWTFTHEVPEGLCALTKEKQLRLVSNNNGYCLCFYEKDYEGRYIPVKIAAQIDLTREQIADAGQLAEAAEKLIRQNYSDVRINSVV